MKKAAALLALSFAAISLAPAADAAALQNVIIGQDASVSQAPVTIQPGEDVFFRVVNPRPEAVTLHVPAINLAYEIPANSERTFFVGDIPPGASGQVAYTIDSPSGVVASGALVQDQTLHTIATSQTSSYVVYSEDEEPTYRTSVPVQRRSTVRGFW